MADKRNGGVVDEVEDGCGDELLEEFVWISKAIWFDVTLNLPVELKIELARACWIDGNSVVIPRIDWLLITQLAARDSVG